MFFYLSRQPLVVKLFSSTLTCQKWLSKALFSSTAIVKRHLFQILRYPLQLFTTSLHAVYLLGITGINSQVGVNFINVLRTNFSYECCFSSYILDLKELSYEKFAGLTLMKLTAVRYLILKTKLTKLVRCFYRFLKIHEWALNKCLVFGNRLIVLRQIYYLQFHFFNGF